MLSPIVYIGPVNVELKKPVVLTVPHCAHMNTDAWTVDVYCATAEDDNALPWERVLTVGEENINSTAYCQLEATTAHIMLEAMGRVALVGRRKNVDVSPTKRMKLCIFAPVYTNAMNYLLRVYCIDDTDAATHAMYDEECRMNGYQVCSLTSINMRNDGGPLCVAIDDIALGWRPRDGAQYQEIPVAHIWCSTTSSQPVHCSITLEPDDTGNSG